MMTDSGIALVTGVDRASMQGAAIIGGMFGLEGRDPADRSPGERLPALLDGPHVRLATARSAFSLLHRWHRPPTVWLPAYLCDVVLAAFAAPAARIRFFPITPELQVADTSWLGDVSSGDMVVFITYFGFDDWHSIGLQARGRGAWVVEDACQALLNRRFSEAAHYVVASPRKFVGVPDGGVLVAQSGTPLPRFEALPAAPVDWWWEAFLASRMRADYDLCGGDRRWYELFCRTEPAAPIEPARMSDLSAALLTRGLDYSAIAGRRRENYARLLEALAEFAIFRDLPDDVVPLGFPIRLAERESVRLHLIREGIFPPVHWPIERAVPREFAMSHRLASEILMLPCDQRYGEREMSRVVDCMLHAIARMRT